MVFSNSVWLVRPVCQQVFISATSLLLENGEINRNAESLESTAGRKYIKPAVTVEDSFHHFRVKMWLHASVACTQIWLVSRFRLDQVTLNIPVRWRISHDALSTAHRVSTALLPLSSVACVFGVLWLSGSFWVILCLFVLFLPLQACFVSLRLFMELYGSFSK